MKERVHKRRGGDVKFAPEGYYTARQAIQRLGITDSAFQNYRKRGQIIRVIPPGKSNGFYGREAIDVFAQELATFDLQVVQHARHPLHTTFAPATLYDIAGLTAVLTSFGWQATPVNQREAWYRSNPRMDYIVRYRSLILGYVNIVPYSPDVLEEMMSGRMRGWDIRPRHILSFEAGHRYDCFAGIAVRDVPYKEYYARHLIDRFVDVLCTMATREHIIIERLYATSSEEEGEQLSQDVGFVRVPGKEGDLFGRFMLDMGMADSKPVRKYREVVNWLEKEVEPNN